LPPGWLAALRDLAIVLLVALLGLSLVYEIAAGPRHPAAASAVADVRIT
jgi:uncharacterized membrane protein